MGNVAESGGEFDEQAQINKTIAHTEAREHGSVSSIVHRLSRIDRLVPETECFAE